MKTKSRDFGTLLQLYFAEYLPQQRNASNHTISGYRDTFVLLLEFVNSRFGIAPEKVAMENLNVSTILAFLDHLERERKNCIRSRNARLAAIHSFFRMVAFRGPEWISCCNQILSIPSKRTDRKLITSLTTQEIEAKNA